MRVLHITHTVPGGIASYLNEVIPYQCRALGLENVMALVPDDQTDELCELNSGNIIGLGSSERSIISLFRFSSLCWDFIEEFQPDILHIHSSFAGVCVRIPLLFSLARSRPLIVYCAHGWSFGMGITELRKRLFAFAEGQLAKVTDVIVNISHDEMKIARERGLSPKKMVVIHNGVSDLPTPAKNNRKRSGRKRLLFVGRLDRQKGLEIALDAILADPTLDVKLDVLGDTVLGDGAGVLATDDRRICFHGWQDSAAVQSWLEQSDVVLMPSRWEGFGLVAIEAFRSKVPVIASDAGALPEIVKHNVNGCIFKAGDAKSLHKILKGISQLDLEALGEQGRRTYLERFTAERMNRALLEVYTSLCGGLTRRIGHPSALALVVDPEPTDAAETEEAPIPDFRGGSALECDG